MTVALLLSGGVDSSVSLRVLQDEGRHLEAFYLKIWLEDELAFRGSCPWEEDLEQARAVCGAAGVPLHVLSLQREYYDRVVSYAVEELQRGHTPSPDIFCNQRIKFGAFLEAIGDEYAEVATGHYARRLEQDGLLYLARGRDRLKDQTYFLSHLRRDQLERCLFPVGEMEKPEVRSLAARYGLPNRDRKDSQGLCFLGKIKFDEFVRAHLGERPGEIRDVEDDRVLGEHRGYWFHTIGQRKGLGLAGGPWFVVAKDVERNVIHVTHAERLTERARREFRVSDVHWITRPPESERLEVKLRHGERLYGARVGEEKGGKLRVELDDSDAGIAPGQFAVFYEGGICLGAGRIEG